MVNLSSRQLMDIDNSSGMFQLIIPESIMVENIIARLIKALLYNWETTRINEQVKRFPDDFMFRLTAKEWETIRSQNARASGKADEKLNLDANLILQAV